MATFYAYKTERYESMPGLIHKELQLASFHTKKDREVFCEANSNTKPVKAADIPAKHKRTFQAFASPLKNGLSWAVVESGTNSQ